MQSTTLGGSALSAAAVAGSSFGGFAPGELARSFLLEQLLRDQA